MINLKLAKNLIEQGRSKQLMPVPLWSNCPVSAGTFYNWGNPKSPIQEFNYSHPTEGFNYFSKIKIPIHIVFADKDFAVGEPAQKCLNILKDKSRSVNFSSTLMKNAFHSYQEKEPELTKDVVDWLRSLSL